jgi:hypothetical protein
MMSLVEDLRMTLQDLCRAVGLSGTAVAAVPAVLLGVVMNVIALGVIDGVRMHNHLACERAELKNVSKLEVKLIRAATVVTIKKMRMGCRGYCSAKQWAMNRREDARRYRREMSCVWSAHVSKKRLALSITMRMPAWSDHCSGAAVSAA